MHLKASKSGVPAFKNVCLISAVHWEIADFSNQKVVTISYVMLSEAFIKAKGMGRLYHGIHVTDVFLLKASPTSPPRIHSSGMW